MSLEAAIAWKADPLPAKHFGCKRPFPMEISLKQNCYSTGTHCTAVCSEPGKKVRGTTDCVV